ncbi:unnamed protein product [Candida verbasci]|uniref:Uncharacterized protein n=1 Tax=Candida verbasci TaxID=1227364 RepID=A0A9W4TVM1_9ASCO|nr:unnamed protein product [Candida verbasci]
MVEPSINRFPQIIIQYCNACKWQNRAIWYLQEILQTFPDLIKDISLQPINETPGVFQIILSRSDNDVKVLYKRKMKNEEVGGYIYVGFPDSKFVKQLIKDEFDVEVGDHISRGSTNYKLTDPTDSECIDCKRA